ncbi:MAG: hypothetical protein SFW09_03185 [Hyphomicrobiaceae bacterium]|nr:hypothetical protein [Hyphomicrobiaceae bacterium]
MPASPAQTRTFLVAYDVAPAGLGASALAEAIMSLGEAWARPLETVWVVRTRRSADEVEASLAPHVGENDGLMVQEARGEPRLANTGLRWFKPRRGTEVAGNCVVAPSVVVAFPDADKRGFDRAA